MKKKQSRSEWKSDEELIAEAYENIFAGIVDDNKKDDDDDKDDEKSKNEESDNEESEDTEKDDKDSEDEESDNDKESSDDEESEDENSDDEESSDDDEDSEEDNSGGDAGIKNKVKSLQKQYNELLKSAFEKYAPECIEDALNETESAFGENIETILDNALNNLRTAILGDLGIESCCTSLTAIGAEGDEGGGMVLDLDGVGDVEDGDAAFIDAGDTEENSEEDTEEDKKEE